MTEREVVGRKICKTAMQPLQNGFEAGSSLRKRPE